LTQPDSTRRGARSTIVVLAGLAALVAGAALLVAALAVKTGGGVSTEPVAPALGAASSLPAQPASGRSHRAASRRAAIPVRLEIPAIGVRAPLVRLGLDREGALEVPSDFAAAGWWSGGSRPGEPGPAVIAGHVDSYTGPAVFFRLGELRRGDVVTVLRADGSRVRFAVERSERHPKSRFPTARVYGPTRRGALRLITCSGAFDRAAGHYADNTVVFAGAQRRRSSRQRGAPGGRSLRMRSSPAVG
jgi:sortase (surface protein transpeptidase)